MYFLKNKILSTFFLVLCVLLFTAVFTTDTFAQFTYTKNLYLYILVNVNKYTFIAVT